jgi:hypothetical protein
MREFVSSHPLGSFVLRTPGDFCILNEHPEISCGHGFKWRMLKCTFENFAGYACLSAGRSCERVGVLFKIKTASWCDALEDFEVPDSMQSREYSRGSGKDGSPHNFFVANVNVNSDGTLKVNVNRLLNDNVWNATNHHRVVVPQPAVSLTFLQVRVFSRVPFAIPRAFVQSRPISPRALCIFLFPSIPFPMLFGERI